MAGSFSFLARLAAALFILIALVPARPAQAAVYTVTTLADENDHSCSDGDCSLRDAIELAPPGSTIQFSVSGTITLNSSLGIGKSLALSGPGASRLTLDAHTAFPLLNITAAHTDNVSLSGLSFANGSSGGRFGGNIYNTNILDGGSTLTIEACIVRGGAASSSSRGGGLYSNGVTSITNSRFENNSAGYGGGIAGSFHNLTITNTVFSANSAASDGGALIAEGSGQAISVTISRSNFSANTAARYGGAIRFLNDVTASLSETYLSNNTTTSSNGNGGAISSTSPLSVAQSVFYANKSGSAATTTNTGGAIYITKALTLTNSTLNANQARSAGGAIHFDTNSSSGMLTNSTITGNSLFGVGADPGLYFSYQTVTAVNSIIAGNTYANGIASDCDSLGLTAASKNNLATSAGCGASATLTTSGALNLSLHGTFLLPGTGSPAIDTGDAGACPAVDQRGWPRPVDGDSSGAPACDIGAVEVTPIFKELFIPFLSK